MAQPIKQVNQNEIAGIDTFYNGGKGSGNFGHKGRPGERGGSGDGIGLTILEKAERRGGGPAPDLYELAGDSIESEMDDIEEIEKDMGYLAEEIADLRSAQKSGQYDAKDRLAEAEKKWTKLQAQLDEAVIDKVMDLRDKYYELPDSSKRKEEIYDEIVRLRGEYAHIDWDSIK